MSTTLINISFTKNYSVNVIISVLLWVYNMVDSYILLISNIFDLSGNMFPNIS